MSRFTENEAEASLRSQMRYWDSMASWYASAYNDSWSQREDRTIGEAISGWVSPSRSDLILDLGCGQGLAAELISPDGCRLIGLDISHEMLSFFARSSDRQALLGDVKRIPLEDGSVDGVISIFGSLSYVAEIDEALLEARRVLKPGSPYVAMVLSRFSADRLVHLQFSREGTYGSQGAPPGGVPATFYTRSARRIFEACGLRVDRVFGLSPWRQEGHFERSAWTIGRMMCALIPELGHALVILGHASSIAEDG